MRNHVLWAASIICLISVLAAQPILPGDAAPSALLADSPPALAPSADPAASDSSSSPTFGTPGLLPPEIPDDSLPTLTLQLVRADTQQPLANTLATLALRDPAANATKTAARYSNAEGKVSCQHAPGPLFVQARVNDPQTPGTDYLSRDEEIDLVASRAQSILLWPAGSLLATVRDADGNLVPGAQLTLSCASDAPNARLQAATDPTGTARFDYAPAGECQLAATHDNRAARATITIFQGQVANADLALSENLIADNPLALIALAALAVILLGGIAYFIVIKPKRSDDARPDLPTGRVPTVPPDTRAPARVLPTATINPYAKTKPSLPKKNAAKPASKKTRPKNKTATKKTAADKRVLTPRQQDLLKTLDEREASVARLLFEHGGKMRANKVRYALMIPKTSFFRIAQNLERRRIARTLKHENFATLALTPWFLTGKDDAEES